MKLRKPKRTDYGKGNEGRSCYRDACQLVALAQLALDSGASVESIEDLLKKFPTDFGAEPVLFALLNQGTK